MQNTKVAIHNRAYTSWEFTQDGVKVDLPHLIPSKHKLFHNDIIQSRGEIVVIKESPFRDTILAGVLILGKTYGRYGKRLLYKCIPDNKFLPFFLVPYSEDASFSKVVKNKYIVFRFTDWSEEHPHGEIKDTIGYVDSNEAFAEYQLYRRGLHLSLTPFIKASRIILRDADPIQAIMNKHEDVEDLRSIENVFTIDPADCTDFDDAFSVCVENGIATINVYIANVFLWLETYQLWEHMTNRVSTIYLPDKKRPMLPPLLSEDWCSLKQGTDRFAFMMSLKYDMQKMEPIGNPIFKNVLVRINKNYDYEDKKLGKNPAYRVLRTLAKTDDSHEVVAFWMIQMNSACADYLRTNGKGIFRKTTEASSPIPENWFTETFSSGAIYSDTCGPHSQLGIDAYTHITSPIRRLVDILNQILFQRVISKSCQTFLDQWTQNLDSVNLATKEIRKCQMDCELLALAEKNEFSEFSGIMFDRQIKGTTIYEYSVYLEKFKMFSRVKTEKFIENFTKSEFKIFVFNDDDRLCRKIRLQLRKP
jgi:exoribonuclease R